MGLRVTGSELVGLIPKARSWPPAATTWRSRASAPGQPRGPDRRGVLSLGLQQLQPFDPKKKIIELAVTDEPKLGSLSLRRASPTCSRPTPHAGGGSVAALSGALGAGLRPMVGNLTVGKKGYDAAQAEMRRVAAAGQTLRRSCSPPWTATPAPTTPSWRRRACPRRRPRRRRRAGPRCSGPRRPPPWCRSRSMRAAAQVAELAESVATRRLQALALRRGLAAAAARTAASALLERAHQPRRDRRPAAGADRVADEAVRAARRDRHALRTQREVGRAG